MRIKIPSPPKLEGQEALCSYLYRLAEILNISLDSQPNQAGGGSSLNLSPKEIFNSIRRLIAGSPEIFDSFRQKLEPFIKEQFLSLESFNLFSKQQNEKFSELSQSQTELETSINSQLDNIRQEIPEIFQNGTWLCRKKGDYAELWGSLDAEQTQYILPISFETALVFPQGELSGNLLTVPENSRSIYITGKEIK